MRFGSQLVSFVLADAVALLTIAACHGPADQSASSRLWTDWSAHPREYATNSVAVAQKETPFRIVVPTYVPADLHPLPTIQGRAKNEFDDELPVIIAYSRPGHVPVTIMEYHKTIIQSPANAASVTQLSYSGTDVLESASETWSVSDGAMVLVPGWTYTWNNHGLTFEVRVYEYEVEEARRIVESMATQ